MTDATKEWRVDARNHHKHTSAAADSYIHTRPPPTPTQNTTRTLNARQNESYQQARRGRKSRTDLAEEVAEGGGGEGRRREGNRGRGVGGGRRGGGLDGCGGGRDESGGHGGGGDELHPETGHLRWVDGSSGLVGFAARDLSSRRV
ncbi:unnamed protein product [Urochloa decumbens]|uniref:Uncharacterized protein n=1 Tax=Urochloa decumbens TaxID=240449 RepID=A0ABC9FX62_9POAL